MRRSRVVAMATATALVGAGLLVGGARAATACAGEAAGGEWREYSHDLANSRNQPDEQVIGPERASALEERWRFDV